MFGKHRLKTSGKLSHSGNGPCTEVSVGSPPFKTYSGKDFQAKLLQGNHSFKLKIQ